MPNRREILVPARVDMAGTVTFLPGLWSAVLLRTALGDERQHGHPDRQHHQRRRGVGHPHRQKAGGEHQTEHDPRGFDPDPLQREERDAAVQVPLFHRDRDQEAAEEQEHDRTRIGRRGLGYGPLGQHGYQNDRQERGDGEGNRLCHPPDRHQRPDRCDPSRIHRQSLRSPQGQPDQRRRDQTQHTQAPCHAGGPVARLPVVRIRVVLTLLMGGDCHSGSPRPSRRTVRCAILKQKSRR